MISKVRFTVAGFGSIFRGGPFSEEQFTGAFKDPLAGSVTWRKVLTEFGCYASNANDWACGMNRIIEILNRIPENASEQEIKVSFQI